MPYERELTRQGWKVKILDRELPFEEPHVTVFWKTKKWRIALREFGFMDRNPDPAEVPKDVVSELRDSWAELQGEWDRRHGDNPIRSSEDV